MIGTHRHSQNVHEFHFIQAISLEVLSSNRQFQFIIYVATPVNIINDEFDWLICCFNIILIQKRHDNPSGFIVFT